MHALLTKCTEGEAKRSMCWAFNMIGIKRNADKRMTSRVYIANRKCITEQAREQRHTPETIEKIRLALTGRTFNDATLKKMSLGHIGLIRPQSVKDQISKTTMGHDVTPDTCEKLRLSLLAYYNGRRDAGLPTITEETREKYRQNTLAAWERRKAAGYTFPEHLRELLRIKATGQRHNEDARKKMSLAARNRPPQTPETIEKRRQSLIAHYDRKRAEAAMLSP